MQGYNDNSGLGPILAEYLDEPEHGQILVLVINKLGDHQMETYFKSSANSNGGMLCEGEVDMDKRTINEIYNRSFKDIGGSYEPGENEKTCAIRLPANVFFEVVSGFRIELGSFIFYFSKFHFICLAFGFRRIVWKMDVYMSEPCRYVVVPDR